MSNEIEIDWGEYQRDASEFRPLVLEFHNLIDGLNDEDRNKPISPKNPWTPKQILAHFSAWAQLTLDSIERAKMGEPIPFILDREEIKKYREISGESCEEYSLDDFNQEEVQARDSMSWDDVDEEYLETALQLDNEYMDLQTHANDKDRTLVEFATVCLWGDLEHYREHIEVMKQLLLNLHS